jgi:serine protease Do
LGIGIQQLNTELAKKLGVEEGQGVLVSDVFEGDPGFEAGLEPGDIITSVDGDNVLTPNDLSIKIAGMVPSQTVRIAIIRDSKSQTLDIVLGKREEGATTASIPDRHSGKSVREKLGVQIHDLTGELAERFKDQTGVAVMEVDKDSPAESAGLRKGDLIKEIDKQAVTSSKELATAMNDIAPGTDVLLRVLRDGRAFFVILRTAEG